MEIFLKITLIIHIAAGFSALISGCIALLSQKGSKNHILSGRIFYYAMIIVAFTAVFIALFKTLTFLFSIAVFSFYLTYTGYRAVKEKSGKANFADWIIMLLTFAVNIYMVSTLNPVLVVFGVISVINIVADLKFILSENILKHFWLVRHIGKMCGAYIATVTAFLVTNIHFMPEMVTWLLPTVIGSPLIAYAIKKYKVKFVA